jgi:hypothetical protein
MHVCSRSQSSHNDAATAQIAASLDLQSTPYSAVPCYYWQTCPGLHLTHYNYVFAVVLEWTAGSSDFIWCFTHISTTPCPVSRPETTLTNNQHWHSSHSLKEALSVFSPSP